MDENRPAAPQGAGSTALIVAQARAIESRRPDRLFDDPFAARFVAAAGAGFAADAPETLTLLRLRGPYVAVRTRYYDDFVLAATAAGCAQVVVLAAGLDARALRLAWPMPVSLYELDLPEVLAFKESVLAEAAPDSAARPARRIVVPVDLAEDWPATLLAAGFDPGRPAAWLAEGILMYLSEDQRNLLLGRIGRLAAPGSRLALDMRGRGILPPGLAAPGQQPGARPEPPAQANPGEAEASRLGVRIPGAELEPSLADPAAWLAGHGWDAQASDGARVAADLGRPLEADAAAGGIQAWLISARR